MTRETFSTQEAALKRLANAMRRIEAQFPQRTTRPYREENGVKYPIALPAYQRVEYEGDE